MIKDLLKELEKIKDIKSKKLFLQKSLISYSEIKTKNLILKLIKELESIEKESNHKEIDFQEINNRLVNSINNQPTIHQANVEEAPKYTPIPNQRSTQESSRSNNLESIASTSDSRIVNQEEPLNSELRREENLTDYIVNITKSREERNKGFRLDYTSSQEITRGLEKIELNTSKTDYRPINLENREAYIANDPEQREHFKWHSNITIDERNLERFSDSKYSADVVENIKKQKKQWESKYK